MGLRGEHGRYACLGEEGIASDFDVRFDMLTMPIDGNNSTPAHPTPAVHVKTDLRAYRVVMVNLSGLLALHWKILGCVVLKPNCIGMKRVGMQILRSTMPARSN